MVLVSTMEELPKVIYGCPEKTIKTEPKTVKGEKTSLNCNICRNFKNINDRNHRMSKIHQQKLTERFRIIRLKMKIKTDSVAVHDEDWGKEEEFFCYFCNKPVRKHKSDAGFTIEFMGLMIHYAESHHKESVKSYLKYHGRKENWDIFCKTKSELENFESKVNEAKRKYLKKLDILNEKDVRQIKETDIQRQKIVENALQCQVTMDCTEVKSITHEQKPPEPNQMFQTKKTNTYSRDNEKTKIPPWLVEKPENDVNKMPGEPVIGPTMETLVKHIKTQEKKGLSMKRVKANLKQKNIGASKWLPAFSGIWNKGRHRQLKSNFHKK